MAGEGSGNANPSTVAEGVMNGDNPPRRDQLSQIGSSDAQYLAAVFRGSEYIVDGCNRILRRDPNNAVAAAVRTKWQPIGRAAEEGSAGTQTAREVFFECMQATSKVRNWEVTGNVTAFETPLPE